MNECVSQIFV